MAVDIAEDLASGVYCPILLCRAQYLALADFGRILRLEGDLVEVLLRGVLIFGGGAGKRPLRRR